MPTDGQRTARVEATITLPPPDAASVVPFEEPTEARVADSVGASSMTQTSTRLDDNLNERLAASGDALAAE